MSNTPMSKAARAVGARRAAETDPRTELVQTAHRVARSGLVVGTSGNISVRGSSTHLWISSSGSRLEELTVDQVIQVSPEEPSESTGEHPYRGREDLERHGPRASMETPFHRAIYRARPDVGAVIHFQSPWATILACAEDSEFDLNFIPEVPAYVRNVGVVPYHFPGTAELAEAIAREANEDDRRILLLRNHGQIAFGPDLATTLRAAEFFEFAARLHGQGVRLRRFDAETIDSLHAYGD